MLTEKFVAPAIIAAAGVLRTIEFNDKLLLATAEVGEVGANRELAGELITAELLTPQLLPQRAFSAVVDPAQRPCAFGRARLSAAARRLPPLRLAALGTSPPLRRVEDRGGQR